MSNSESPVRGRRRAAAVIISLSILLAGAGGAGALSPHEEELARRIRFDAAVLRTAKEAAGEQVRRLIGYSEEGYQLLADGISVAVPQERTAEVLRSLRRKLRPRQYLVFIADINSGTRTDMIGIIRGTDQYEIIRLMQTNGASGDLPADAIIGRLKEWEKRWPFDIVGAGYDWVEIEFRILPKDLSAVAEAVSELCPDLGEQGEADAKELTALMGGTRRLFLWWE